MRWLWVGSLFACNGPAPTDEPASSPAPTDVSPTDVLRFPGFFETLQDRVCDAAVSPCSSTSGAIDCATEPQPPTCAGFDVDKATECLAGEFLCTPYHVVQTPLACREVCQDRSFAEFGELPIPASCREMLECDAAISQAAGSDYQRVFQGASDTAYGVGGTCYNGDPQACATACATAVANMIEDAERMILFGQLSEVPERCYGP